MVDMPQEEVVNGAVPVSSELIPRNYVLSVNGYQWVYLNGSADRYSTYSKS